MASTSATTATPGIQRGDGKVVVTGGEYHCDDKRAADPCAAELFDPESATESR